MGTWRRNLRPAIFRRRSRDHTNRSTFVMLLRSSRARTTCGERMQTGSTDHGTTPLLVVNGDGVHNSQSPPAWPLRGEATSPQGGGVNRAAALTFQVVPGPSPLTIQRRPPPRTRAPAPRGPPDPTGETSG